MIPLNIRNALWDLMDNLEKATDLTGSDAEECDLLYMACVKMGEYLKTEKAHEKAL
jgi:hypothetical protein